MSLQYHTEYRLGRRGRICRSYTGFQALVAIALDLVFGLLFEALFLMVGLVARFAVLAARTAVQMVQLYWRIMVAAMTFVVYAVTLPFAWVHEAVDRLRSPQTRDEHDGPSSRQTSAKPSWALSREV